MGPSTGPDGCEATDSGKGEGTGTAGSGAGAARRARVSKTTAVDAEHVPAPGRLQEEEGGLVQLNRGFHDACRL